MSDKKGVIYILTNPSFPDYVKIGYADDIDKRLKQLNRSECIPFAFRVYATYEVNSRLSDLKLHEIIDKLNPDLRSIDDFNGQKRIREFYAMKPEEAYAILEAMAEIHDCKENLKLVAPSDVEVQEEQLAQEIDTESHEKAENFSFTKCQIPVGEEIEYYDDPSIKCKVVGDRKVEYQGKEMSLTAAEKLISGKKYSIAGPRFFKYKGESDSEYLKKPVGKDACFTNGFTKIAGKNIRKNEKI